MAISISLTGISPLHGSHAALSIACDASNARTVAVREYPLLAISSGVPLAIT